MKYASSIRYSGQLVDAIDCDYQSYKELGLLCPNCKSSVFLQGESERALKKKVITVPSHFKHFAAKDPVLAKECENRVAKYDQKEIERRATIARNQRLKILQRHFWSILVSNPVVPSFEKCLEVVLATGEQYRGFTRERTLNSLQSQFEEWRDEFILNRSKLCYVCTQTINFNLDSGLKATSPIFEEWVRRLKSVDRDMHIAVCVEVLSFLLSKQSSPLLFKCFVFGISEHASTKNTQSPIDMRKMKHREGIAQAVVNLITCTPWAEKFANLQNANTNHDKYSHRDITSLSLSTQTS